MDVLRANSRIYFSSVDVIQTKDKADRPRNISVNDANNQTKFEAVDNAELLLREEQQAFEEAEQYYYAKRVVEDTLSAYSSSNQKAVKAYQFDSQFSQKQQLHQRIGVDVLA